jgi:ATP-dependent Clp protease ATP-binding subunit ClpC
MIDTLRDRLSAMDIEMTFDDEVKKLVAKAGFDPVYGARPLRRALQNKVEDMLSEEILSGNITAQNKYICSVSDEHITVRPQ